MSYGLPYSDSNSPSSTDSYHSLKTARVFSDDSQNTLQYTKFGKNVGMEDRSALEILGSISPTDAKELLQLLNAQRQYEAPNENNSKKFRKNITLPRWNGKSEDFEFYIGRLETRVERELAPFVESAAICLDMIDTLPEKKQSRVSDWFEESRSNENFSWQDLIKVFRREFENKEARQAASEIVSRMEQGKNQLFVDFLRDFEYRLAQSGGNEAYTPLGKTQQLKASLNPRLRRSLIGVKLPSAKNYREWVMEVKEVAAELEAAPGYRSINAPETTTKIGIPKGGTVMPEINSYPEVDSDGDTVMGGTNALLAVIKDLVRDKETLLANIENYGAGKKSNVKGRNAVDPRDERPRAPWRSVKDFQELREKGLCTRCTKKGHSCWKCPNFRQAKRSNVRLNALESPTEEADDDSGNESS